MWRETMRASERSEGREAGRRERRAEGKTLNGMALQTKGRGRHRMCVYIRIYIYICTVRSCRIGD